MNPLVEQAVRVLDHQPTRSMDAQVLYRRARQETGSAMTFGQFLETVRANRDRFALIERDLGGADDRGWDARSRSQYRAAMEEAGADAAIIMLAERPVDPDRPRRATGTAADILADVHESLADLLLAAGEDESLRAALAVAVEEMHVLGRYVAPGVSDGAV